MRRWHQERNLMLRRWREEIQNHTRDRNGSWYGLAPIPPVVCDGEEPCHCFRGPGFMRKRTAHGCGNPRCGICHYEKFYEPKRRAEKRRREIEYELNAYGLEVPAR